MSEIQIAKGIMIDEVGRVMGRIRELSSTNISDIETVKRFIVSEKNTMFYIDSKMGCRMERDADTRYIWLDSGYTDVNGKPIFISTERKNGMFCGHITGTAKELSNSLRQRYTVRQNVFKQNYSNFCNKYQKKIEERNVAHITDEHEYLVGMMNEPEGESEFARMIRNLNVVWAQDLADDEEVIEETVEATEEAAMTEEETEITISILLERLESVQAYVAELEEIVAQNNLEKEELKKKNEEYHRVLNDIRCFAQSENSGKSDYQKVAHGVDGHNLLDRNKKILVLGDAAIGNDVMRAIAKKDFGFDKNDLEFVTDYQKVVHETGRIKNADRYQAVIFGRIPHKVAMVGQWSSAIEKFKCDGRCTIVVDARNIAGDLKVTRQSFRAALVEICNELGMQWKGVCA